MKIVTYCITLTMWVLALTYANAQETQEENVKISILKNKKEDIINAEKEALKNEVLVINGALDQGAITASEAENKKKLAAEKHALNIENKIAIIDNHIALLERNGEVGLNTESGKISIGIGDLGDDGDFILGIKINDGQQKERAYDKRTFSDIVVAFGLNNAIADGQSIDDSPYKIGGSRFAEFGISWNTRVFKESNWLRFKYGLSFQFNGLKPEDNRYFVDNGATTQLEEFAIDLDKSKFRMDNLVVPVFFEIGPSKKREYDDYFRYDTDNSFKIGFGGYAGINLSTRQKLKFSDDGEDVKQKLKANYNTNNFIYGLAAYVGYGDTSLYLKYDLNPIFKDNLIEERNVSLGLRFDLD
ncbi:porin family protein [Ulvibacter antarcticus]|uniref:Outer membrane protein with beta-barrel domain n=1 Tax=Ulvibacter antarcticus TaxID=442714 RepID=A0A3L9YEY0_9FLAO|nr:hypothetical protein [Ulvibacter antarcticus]RMA57679.1 hypothetical protein BXY75_2483 [Ulvibacter antarcticus]